MAVGAMTTGELTGVPRSVVAGRLAAGWVAAARLVLRAVIRLARSALPGRAVGHLRSLAAARRPPPLASGRP